MIAMINNQPLSLNLICETIINATKEKIKQIYSTNVVVIDGSKVVKIPVKLAEVIYGFNERSCASNN
jgi:hypothetical protein